MGQVAGVVVGSCSSRSGRVQAQGQRGHAEGVLGRGIGPETTEILLWYRTRGYSIRQLSGQTAGERRGKTEKSRGELDLCVFTDHIAKLHIISVIYRKKSVHTCERKVQELPHNVYC